MTENEVGSLISRVRIEVTSLFYNEGHLEFFHQCEDAHWGVDREVTAIRQENAN